LAKVYIVKNFKILIYAEKSALSKKNKFGPNHLQESRKISKKPKNFGFFEIRPLHPQFRLFLKFFYFKKFLIFYSILQTKPHPIPLIP